MLKSLLVVLLFYLLLLVAESSSQAITPKESKVGGKTCEQLLEKFWESNGMNIEGEYELITIQKLNSKSEALNQILSEREQLVEYEIELTSTNEAKFITGFTIVADVGSCQQPMGWFDHLDPEWNSTQCMLEQLSLLQVSNSYSRRAIKIIWTTSKDCSATCSFRYSMAGRFQTTQAAHKLSTREISNSEPVPSILLANAYFIHQLSLDSTREQTVVSEPRGGIWGIDYHYRMGRLFWTSTNNDAIMMSNLDGSLPRPVLNEGLRQLRGLSVDWINDKIYFVESNYGTGNDYIGVLDFVNNHFMKLITTSVGNLEDVVVDPTTRWLYWNDNFLNKIEKASMDGKNRTIIINTNVPVTHSLTLDYQHQILYWIDSDYRVLESSTVNGTNRKTIYSFSQSYTFYGISIFKDTLYLSQHSSTIYRVSTSGQNFTSISIPYLCRKNYRQLKISSEERQPMTGPDSNPCENNNGGCSHLCLLSAVDPRGYSCNCPHGMSLGSDQNTCTGAVSLQHTQSDGSCIAAGYNNSCCSSGSCLGGPSSRSYCHCDANCRLFEDCCSDIAKGCQEQELTEYIMITNQNFIHKIDINSALSRYRLQTPLSNLKNAYRLDYHYRNDQLFWTDTYNNSLFIWHSSLINGSDAAPLVDTGSTSRNYRVDIAVDWITDKIYWTKLNQIMVYDIKTGYKATVITEPGASFHQVVVDPSTSTIYWSDLGNNQIIRKASMDGSGSSTVVNNGYTGSTYDLVFTLDRSHQVLYWINGTRNNHCYLQRSNIDGSNRSIVFNATRYSGGCSHYYYRYYSTQPDMDFFEGAVYTYYPYYGYIQATNIEGRPYVSTINSYRSYVCNQRSFHGFKVISRQRQLQSFNPCTNNNGGCAHLCLLSSTHPDGYTCACHSGARLLSNKRDCTPNTQQPEDIQGSCLAAGYSSCCIMGSCKGEPPNCYCDSLCHVLDDCCSDASTLMCARRVFNKTIAPAQPTPLGFVKTPLNQTILQHERVELQCFVRSTNTPNFIWTFTRKGHSQLIVNGYNPLTLGYFVELGERSQILIIREAQWVQEGSYRCSVSTDRNTIHAEAALNVLVPASEIDIAGDISINGGLTTFTVMCSVNANPPAIIAWYNTNDEVDELTNTSSSSITHRFTADMAPISLSTLVISATGSNDYMCVADNNVGDGVSLNFSLIKTGHCNCIRTFKGSKCLVEGQSTEVLVFITMPEDQTAVDGNSVEFPCSACSTLEPTIMWTFTRKGSMHSEIVDENSTFVDLIPGENSLSLTINAVNWTYEGVYRCLISTENNQIEAEASLNVLIPASEVEISGNTATPDEQQTLIIECRVVANPPANFEWSRDNEVLNDSRVSITNQFDYTDEPTSTSILTVRNITVSDGGDYVCTAENSLSSSPVSANFTVTVTELPPAPVDVRTSCNLIIWRNAPNISFGDIAGYEIRLINTATEEEVVKHLDASATFYSLDHEKETFKQESTFVQVRVLSNDLLGLFSSPKSLGCYTPVSEPPPPPVNIQSSCDLVTWHNAPNISFDDIIGYEIRLTNSAKSKEIVKHLNASATFYKLDELSETLKSELTSVQIRLISSDNLGQFSALKPLECHQSLPPVSGVYIHMQGRNYTNNSVMNIADVGVGDDALLCMTDRECCCGVPGYRQGQFYYPDGSQVPVRGGGNVFYRDRREKMIRLNRKFAFYPTGRYRCEIPNARGEIQTLYFTLSV